MTPKFADALDPVFLMLLPILDRLGAIDGHESVDGGLTASELRRRLEHVLRDADDRLDDIDETGQKHMGNDWRNFGKYALVSWIDEMLGLAHDWPGQTEWKEQPLELKIFSTRECNEEFYKRASRAPREASRDSIEMYYICVVLGFVGLYRDPNSSESKSQIDRLGLPPDRASWLKEYGERVKKARVGIGQDGNGPSDRSITPATPHWQNSSLVWPVVLGIIGAGVNVLAWWGW